LSFAWPRTPQQTAVVLQPGDSPLFPYGYGLRYHDDGDLKKLSEDAGTADANTTDTHVFFAAGRTGAGWSWVVGQGVTMAPADKAAQEDARQFGWNGTAPAWVGLTSPTAIDLQREANGQLSLAFDYKSASPVTTSVALRVDCGAACRGTVPIARELVATPAGQWGHLKVPLVCFARAGADMGHVSTPFALETAGRLSLAVANIRLESGTDGVAPCPDGPAFK
jgi:beta-glucosidase